MYDIKKTYKPATVEEAVKLLNDNSDAVVLAGGTDVMIKLKARKLKEATLVYIREIPELQNISIEADGTIVIGAATVFNDIFENEIIRKKIPLLSHACNTVGSPQIRNIGTIGGNICNGAVSADSVPSLYCLNAVLEIRNSEGLKTVPISNFHVGPGKTILEHGDILTAIRIPKSSYDGFKGCYIKFGQRNAMEISTLSCAVMIKAQNNIVKDARFAFGVAAPVPIRCYKLEKAIINMTVNEDLFVFIENNVLQELNPRDSWRASKELREQLIKTLSVRAVKQCLEC